MGANFTAAATLLLLLLLVALVPPGCRAQALNAQLLLWFKSNLTNGEEKLPSWQPETESCTWDGVGCSSGWPTEL